MHQPRGGAQALELGVGDSPGIPDGAAAQDLLNDTLARALDLLPAFAVGVDDELLCSVEHAPTMICIGKIERVIAPHGLVSKSLFDIAFVATTKTLTSSMLSCELAIHKAIGSGWLSHVVDC
jgi:hypothetical protein